MSDDRNERSGTANDDEMSAADADLGRRLGDALRADADAVTPSPDAWMRLTERIAGAADDDVRGGVVVSGDEPGVLNDPPAIGATRIATPRRSWRLPMIVAAAVVAIAVVMAVVVARRSAPDTASAPASCAAATTVPVPVDLSGGEQIGWSNGAGSAPATGGSASGGQRDLPAASDAMTSGSPTWLPGATGTGMAAPVTDIAMGFGGPPTSAPLCVRPAAAGSSAYRGVDTDGTPLGYLTMIRIGTLSYLVGAVGPEVEQVQVLASPGGPSTASSDDIDPGFTDTSYHWSIDSGRGTPWSLPDATGTVWTDLGGAWHGFALLLPAGAARAEVFAIDRTGVDVQLRSIDLSTGRTTDGSPPPATTTYLPGSSTPRSPVGFSSGAAASESPGPSPASTPVGTPPTP